MSNEEILKLPFGELLDKFKDITNISQNSLGNAIGIKGGSQLSQIRHGKYNDVDGTEEKARIYMAEELKKRDENVFVKPILEFSHVVEARGRINKTIKQNKIILLRGNSGTGKTTLLLNIKKKNSNSFMIKAYKGMTRRELIRLICHGCGAGAKSTTIAEISSFMKNKILILDEANKLSGGSLEWLRSLQDDTKSPMVWAGTHEDITEVLFRQEELDRRCKKAYLYELEDAEVYALVEAYELAHTQRYYELLINHFKGRMGMCVEVLDDMKNAVLNGHSKDSESTFVKLIDMME